MKVVLVQEAGRYGGANKMLYWLCSALYKSHFDVLCVTLQESEDIEKYSIGWRYLELRSGMSPSFIKRNTIDYFNKLNRFFSVCKREKPDILISFGDHSFYQAYIVSKVLRIPLIVSERVDPYTSRSKTDVYRRKLYKHCDYCVFQTVDAQNYYHDTIKEKSSVIPNPVVIGNTMSWKKDNVLDRIIYIGRIDNIQKRIDLLVDAFKIVHNAFPSIQLCIFGDGRREEIDRLSLQIDSLELSDYVVLMGVTKNPKEELLKSKLFVLSSDFEGIPNSLIEAMEVGIPVVSTDCSPGGARLLIGDGEYGELVPRNDPDFLAKGIIRVLNNYEFAIQKARNGFASLGRFSEDKIEKKWIDVISRFSRD